MSLNNDDEFKVAFCPICNQGWVIIQKDTVTDRLVVYCEECMLMWKCPEDLRISNTATFGGVIKLKNESVAQLQFLETPTYEEIEKYKWNKFLLTEG